MSVEGMWYQLRIGFSPLSSLFHSSLPPVSVLIFLILPGSILFICVSATPQKHFFQEQGPKNTQWFLPMLCLQLNLKGPELWFGKSMCPSQSEVPGDRQVLRLEPCSRKERTSNTEGEMGWSQNVGGSLQAWMNTDCVVGVQQGPVGSRHIWPSGLKHAVWNPNSSPQGSTPTQKNAHSKCQGAPTWLVSRGKNPTLSSLL